MKKFFVLGLAAVAGLANAGELYSNGPLVNAAGLSISGTGPIAFGSIAGRSALADDFSVASGTSWNVQSIDLFAYQSFAHDFTFTNVKWSIVSGDVNTGTVLASGTTAVTNGGFVGYRVTSASTPDTYSPIYRINADIPDITLSTGSYWLTWSLDGTGGSGPWVPPVSSGTPGANAMQSLSGAAFKTVISIANGLPAELPFSINGVAAATAVPEPTTSALMLLGLLGLGGIARRRSL